jgi:hypothetical protein
MNKARNAFKALFINEWNSCNQYRASSCKLLIADSDYMDQFAEGAGIKILPQFK